MKKLTFLFLLAGVALLSFISCSKTVQALGVDAINNAAQVGRWEVTQQNYIGSASEPATSQNLTEGEAYAQFKSGKIMFYNSAGVAEPNPKDYNFIDSKNIVYGGVQYTIQETLAGSFNRMTIQRSTTTGREVYIFTRP